MYIDIQKSLFYTIRYMKSKEIGPGKMFVRPTHFPPNFDRRSSSSNRQEDASREAIRVRAATAAYLESLGKNARALTTSLLIDKP
jgi:hypothetical protein